MTSPSAQRRFSTQVAPDIQARVRAAVAHIQTHEPSYTLAVFTSEALEAALSRTADLYNDGDPWPTTAPQLRRGARLGGARPEEDG